MRLDIHWEIVFISHNEETGEEVYAVYAPCTRWSPNRLLSWFYRHLARKTHREMVRGDIDICLRWVSTIHHIGEMNEQSFSSTRD